MFADKVFISSLDISQIEHFLLDKGDTFDRERRDYIKNLDTVDLHAVPGSGKTTALLAKLLVIEKKLPFNDGSGVLVLSHTNAAVDEIKNRIGRYCPRLFSYPNHIGTIQSFVDNFLAIPYFNFKNKERISRIDNDIYVQRMESELKRCIAGQPRDVYKKVLYIYHSNPSVLNSYRFHRGENSEVELVSKINGPLLEVKKPRSSAANYLDYSIDEKVQILAYLKQLKINILKQGALCFDDAYFLANEYIRKYPKIIKIIQERFRFVFVDEMQDMESHQSDLLEKLFFKKKVRRHVFQRVGDNNQAIFQDRQDYHEKWSSNSRKVLRLNGSHRLNTMVSAVVTQFGVKEIDVYGLNKKSQYKPHLIIFDSPTDVLEAYCKLIVKYGLSDEKNPFFAIGWTAENEDQTKLGIKSYFPDFEKTNSTSSNRDYGSLITYFYSTGDDNKSFSTTRKNLLNAVLKLLRLTETSATKQSNGKDFTKRTLLDHLKENHNQNYFQLKLKLYTWSLSVIKGEISEAHEDAKEFLIDFLSDVFGVNELNSVVTSFLNNVECEEIVADAPPGSNTFKDHNNQIKVSVGTIHSVKGRTHTATLYLETFYQRSCIGGSYESERLIQPLCSLKKVNELLNNTALVDTDFKRRILTQSARMMYVGFSRPTHLLCFAVNKERITVTDELKDVWEIVDLTLNT